MTLRWYRRSFFTAFVLYFRQQITDGFVLFTILVQPLLYALLVGFMFRSQGAQSAATVTTIGGTMMGLWGATLYRGTAAINSERRAGTLDILVATPLPLIVNIGAKITASLCLALTSFVLSYGAAVLATDTNFTVINVPGFVGSLVIGVFGLALLGLWFASAAILNPGVEAIVNGLEILGYLIGGFVIPIEFLPHWVTPISYLFIPYWVTQGLRTAALGPERWSLSEIWLIIAALSGVYLFLSLHMLRVVLLRARREGTLPAM